MYEYNNNIIENRDILQRYDSTKIDLTDTKGEQIGFVQVYLHDFKGPINTLIIKNDV